MTDGTPGGIMHRAFYNSNTNQGRLTIGSGEKASRIHNVSSIFKVEVKLFEQNVQNELNL